MKSHFLEEVSLTEQIMNEVNKMEAGQKQKLLIQLRKEEILKKVKCLDKITAEVKPLPMTDEEADNYISEQRRRRYEQSKA